jgi:hypothetical protein
MPPTPHGRGHHVRPTRAAAQRRTHRRRADGRGGVGFSRLARGRLWRGAGQGDRWSGSSRGSGVDEAAEVASGGGVPTTTRSGDGRWESGKDPTSLVSKEGG